MFDHKKKFFIILVWLSLLCVAMDQAELPRECQESILTVCYRDLPQEDRIAGLVTLRRVCKGWASILTFTRIAEIFNISGKSEELESAIQQDRSKTLELICKAYPDLLKTLKEVPMFTLFTNNVDYSSGYYHHARYPKTIRLLLSYHLNPQVEPVEVSPDGRRKKYANEDGLVRSLAWWDTKESKECFDQLMPQTFRLRFFIRPIQKRFWSPLVSKICYLVGAVVLGGILYKYWWQEETDEEDAQNDQETINNDDAQDASVSSK